MVTVGGKRLTNTCKTRSEGQSWIKKTLGQMDQGLSYDGARAIAGEYLASWLAMMESKLAYSTHAHYRQILRDDILPGLGTLRLRDLTTSKIETHYAALRRQGKSEWIVDLVHQILRQALGHAVELGLIGVNPIMGVIVPSPKAPEMNILGENEISRLLIQARGQRNEALYYLALNTGARLGELLGLKWDDVDWQGSRLRIIRQLKARTGSGLVLVDLKTRYSRRMIEIGQATMQRLRAHYETQWQVKAFAGVRWKENNLVFSTSIGTPIGPRNQQRDFKALLNAAGLPDFRFHDLRHTAASIMLNRGIPVIVVSRRLGHSRPSITMDIYGHLMPGVQSSAAELMDEVITPIEVNLDS